MGMPVAALRRDGWKNALTGVGDLLYDKRLATSFEATDLTDDEAEQLWEGNDVMARIVETLPNDMTREGFKLAIQDKDSDVSETMHAQFDELGLLEKACQALWYQRSLGGGALLIGAEDGQQAWKPLDLTRVKKVSWLTALSKRELVRESTYADPREQNFGEAETYRIRFADSRKNNKGVLVHESRLIVFQGIAVSRRALERNKGWGKSVLTRVYEVVRDFESAWASAVLMLGNAGIRRLKMKGLAELIAGNDENALVERARQLDLARSICRADIVDSEEDMETEPLQISGLPEILEKFELRVCAAAEMPRTKLFGASPGGLNATGDSDERIWFDAVKGRQTKQLLPALNKFVKVCFSAKQGPTGGKEPPNWTLSFNPLRQQTQAEITDMRNKQAQTDKLNIDAGVLHAEEVATSRFGGDEYSFETTLDFDLRAQFEKAQEAVAATAPDPAAEAGQQPANEENAA
jgi:phage-related protein (TIGR01555 family)